MEQMGNPIINISIFVGFVIMTMGVVIRVSQTSSKKRAGDFYTGGAQFSGRQNGFAIAGDYLSAASFLGITGAVAMVGFDGFLYSVGWFVAWLVALLLVAEPLRNTGRYTMGDVLSFRMDPKPIRMAAAMSTLTISFFYLVAQMAGAGSLVSLLLGVEGDLGQNLVVALVGIVMVGYVLIGGMKGTTWVQMIKAVLLIAGVLVMAIWVLAMKGFNFSALLGEAVGRHIEQIDGAGIGEAFLEPMSRYGDNPLGFISLSVALIFGAAGLPHVLMRFYTVPTAGEARRSASWAITLIGTFYLLTIVLGYGAAWLVGPDAIAQMPGGQNAAAPALAFELGGTVLMAVVAGVAFATILAVVAGLTITASASFAHDVYNAVIKDGKADPKQEVRVARITSLVIGAVSIIGGIVAKDQNVAFLVALAFAISASANLPSILFSLYWKKFSTTGSLMSIYGGLATALILLIFSPAISGAPSAMLGDGVDFAWFPLDNPALVSVPVGFFLGWLGSVLKPDGDKYMVKAAEMEVRSMTGAGAEGALDH